MENTNEDFECHSIKELTEKENPKNLGIEHHIPIQNPKFIRTKLTYTKIDESETFDTELGSSVSFYKPSS